MDIHESAIEALRADLNWVRDNCASLPTIKARVDRAISTLGHLTTRLSEVERERDEARALNTGFAMTLDEDRQDHEEKEQHLRARITELEAEVARLTKERDDEAKDANAFSSLLDDMREHVTILRTQLATLRATVDRLTDGMDEAAFTDWKERAIRSMQAASDAAGVICCDLVPEAIATLRAAIAEAIRRADDPSRYAECFSFEAAKYITEPLRNIDQPEPEDALVAALKPFAEIDLCGWGLPPDFAMNVLAARKALASLGLVRGEGVEW